MSSEENYLDDLLNHVLEPKPAEPMNEVQVAETNAEQDIQDDLRISDIEELEPEASEQNSEITELEMPELEDICRHFRRSCCDICRRSCQRGNETLCGYLFLFHAESL